MKQSSFLVSILAIASVALLIIGIGLGIATGYDCIKATNETTSMITMSCASGIIGIAITAIIAALQYQPKILAR